MAAILSRPQCVKYCLANTFSNEFLEKIYEYLDLVVFDTDLVSDNFIFITFLLLLFYAQQYSTHSNIPLSL